MKTWQRATQAVRCGGLHDRFTVIPKGAPMLVIAPTLTKRFFRCEACAGEPAPLLPGIGPAVVAASDRLPAPMVRPTRAAFAKLLPFDFKAAQAGREE